MASVKEIRERKRVLELRFGATAPSLEGQIRAAGYSIAHLEQMTRLDSLRMHCEQLHVHGFMTRLQRASVERKISKAACALAIPKEKV